MSTNQLKTSVIYCGDNLEMLKEIPDESVDLIYIDPPFNSNRNYETFWGDTQERRAFEDRFGNAEAYIAYMRPRVLEMYRVVKQTGNFYYHCDWHASHYVKIMLDQIFGFNNFQNEIIWSYQGTGEPKKFFKRKHDTIFFYSKTDNYFFDEKSTVEPISDFSKSKFTKKDENGNYKEIKHPDGTVHKQYMRESMRMRDVWEIPIINAMAKERLGYPTQKPLALLERIIEASSSKGDAVLDAFCGCGTALVAAQKLGRKWVGIDISPTACRVIAQRLWDTFKLEENKDFQLVNMLRDEKQLREIPPFEFENWAVIALGGIPNRVKVGDYGIDGKLYPVEREKIKEDGKNLFGDIDMYYPIQVKQKEKAGRPDIDAFETAMRRDGRKRGYFISFGFTEDAVREMKRLDKEGELEIVPITVEDLLEKEKLMK